MAIVDVSGFGDAGKLDVSFDQELEKMPSPIIWGLEILPPYPNQSESLTNPRELKSFIWGNIQCL